MHRLALVVLLAVCLLVLSACGTESPTPALEIQGQSAEDSTVIFRAVIDKPGWLVLFQATPEGELDTSAELKHAYLDSAGEYTDINMNIGGVIVGETKVFAVLHYDDPADGGLTFSPGGADDPPVEVEDEIVAVSFTVTGPIPYISVDEGESQGNIVAINAFIDRPGWLVLHPPTSEGEPDTGNELGHVYLTDPGEYEGIQITVPTDNGGERVVFAMLHYDYPEDGEFVLLSEIGEDPPVEVEGEPVVVTIRVGG